MTDPFSVAAGVAGLITLGIQVTKSLIEFYNSYRGQDTDVARTTGNLESLLSTFRCLDDALQSRIFRPDEQGLIKNIESSLYKCDELIQELKKECKRFDKASISGIKGTIKVAGRRAAYPLRQSTLQKLEEDISEIRENLSLALEVLQLRDHQTTQDDITGLKSLVEVVRASQISSTIRDWLRAPDATVNHDAACAKRHQSTGMWFVKGPIFDTWLTRDRSFLWLNGFAGCGKSVLCSTAIQYTFRHKRSDRGVGIAFFYFTFDDESKQDESAMLRALLLQLSGQLSDSHTDLARLHGSYRTGIPPAIVLTVHLRHLVRKFDQVYILFDALDESPRYGQRDQVLNTIETMRKWLLPGLHLLVTSRDEPDIRKSLSPVWNEEVIMKNAEINHDISNFISGQLEIDPKLRKWCAHHDRIQQVLAERAQGVFRWVECQFESLRRCPRSECHLERCLQTLPRSLDETYERILCSIDEGSIKDARRILTLLCFSFRPLKVQEVIDGIAVDLDEPACLNLRRRLQDADDLREICPGLIDVGVERDDETQFESDGYNDIEGMTPTVRIAHFSVQEYLESDRITQQKAASFALQSASAHAEIAQICLIYLQEPGLSSGTLDQTKLKDFPLAHFAALFWHHHYRNATSATSRLNPLILRILQQHQGSFYTWVKLHNPDEPWATQVDLSLDSSDIASPVYYASLLGLDIVLYELISICQELASEGRDLINARGGYYGNALQAASEGGHEKVVQILIDAEADVNAQGGYYSNNALYAASLRDYEKIVQILIDAGADVNAQGEDHDNALYAASMRGYEKIVQILIDAGADVNAQNRYHRNALYTASEGGHEKVVQILIDAEADVNAQGEYYGNALQAASEKGHEKVVQILIDAEADVNAQIKYYDHALYAASTRGHEKVVQILIDAEVDVTAQDVYDKALYTASREGYEKVVQILINAGADVNAQRKYRNYALNAASTRGHEKVVQILIDAGADVNAQGGYYSNALHAASTRGHEKVVQILIDAGADVNAQGGDYGNALQAASEEGHEKVVQILIDAGADVNAQGGYYSNALHAASTRGHEKVVQILIDAGADVNAQGGDYGNALQAASEEGH